MSSSVNATPVRHIVNVATVSELKAQYNNIMINGVQEDELMTIDMIVGFLVEIASYEKSSPVWNITSGARREARIWMMSQAADHLKKVIALFE